MDVTAIINDSINEYPNNNYIVAGADCSLKETTIRFEGKGNICFFEGNLRLEKCFFEFYGDNNLIYLRKNGYIYHMINIKMYNNSVFHFGVDGICQELNVILSEGKHAFIGDYCAFSFGIWIRSADPHLIYDSRSRMRINPSKSVFVGDHVWLGQNALLLKGTEISSGSIIGANSVVSNKKIPSNTIWGGNPVRQIKDNVFWDQGCVHKWLPNDTEKNIQYPDLRWDYTNGERIIIPFDEVEKEMNRGAACVDYLTKLDEINERWLVCDE